MPPDTELATTVESADAQLTVPGLEDGRLTDERDSPIVAYQYRQEGSTYRPTAPINLVFDLEEPAGGLDRVMSVLEAAGWVRAPEEYVRYAYDYEADEYVRQEATAAETYYGTSGRRHVRCWQFDTLVSMQAHEDTGARPKHGIESYTDTREYLEKLYAAADWRVTPRALSLENDEPPDHDGYATLITEGSR